MDILLSIFNSESFSIFGIGCAAGIFFSFLVMYITDLMSSKEDNEDIALKI